MNPRNRKIMAVNGGEWRGFVKNHKQSNDPPLHKKMSTTNQLKNVKKLNDLCYQKH